DGILHRALALQPNDLIATAGLGQLALSRHRFREALALGVRARRISPTTGGVYGVIGDAELELGRYPQAFHAFDRMAAIKPGVASYARVSYARELLGRTASAERAMRLAIDSAIGEREAGAWTRSQLGLLYLATGRPREAATAIRSALELARRGYRERPSVVGDDVLSWALARNGRCSAALAYSERALRLGTQDALKFFHRGYVEACLGHPAAARAWYGRALALNPHFSILWA